MSSNDIYDCYSENLFVLTGDNLIKRFGSQAVDFLHTIPLEVLNEIAESSNVNEALKAHNQVRGLVKFILSNILSNCLT